MGGGTDECFALLLCIFQVDRSLPFEEVNEESRHRRRKKKRVFKNLIRNDIDLSFKWD